MGKNIQASRIIGLETPPKVYRVLLTQTSGINGDAPVATILENTLGFVPTWHYDATGIYSITETFTQDVTYYTITPSGNPNFIHGIQYDPGVNKIKINTNNFYSTAYVDGVLTKTPVEVIVYQ